jgi:predicted nucleic acid-binding protein
MAFRILLDAGVLLDLLLKREAYAPARQLMQWAVNGRLQVFITSAIVQEIGHRLTETYGPERAKELLLALLAEVQLIDAGYETTVSALHSRMENIPDALSYYAALHHRLDYFITHDREIPKAAIPVLPACSPEEFLRQNSPQPIGRKA